MPDVKLVRAAAVGDAITRAKKPALKSCDLDPTCLSEVGKLVGANIVIAGEVVGIGDAKVIYLNASESPARKRSRRRSRSAARTTPPAARKAR